jgi:RecA-family ATPase
MHGPVPLERFQAETQLRAITPAKWRDTPAPQERWLAQDRIVSGDLTILSGNGGSGKTEIITALLLSVAAGLGDWLGCVVESGPALFVSCEESEDNIRSRIERIAKHRGVDPYAIDQLHLVFPDLAGTWLCNTDQRGKVTPTPLLSQIEAWIIHCKPALVAIDSVAAVFDGDAVNRRQVRAFLALLRKLARQSGAAIVLLDHPSVRGMADGTGTSNSVDWRNSVRGMMYLGDPPGDDPDARTLSFTKNNRGRKADAVELRWTGLTFAPVAAAVASPYRAAADREIDDLFLKLLDKRNSQGRHVHASTAKGSAPAEFADDPEARGVKASAFRAAMERLFTTGTIRVVDHGPPSKRRQRIERVS